MKILVINGSPSSTRSNTLKLTNTFVEGLNQVGEKNKIDFFDLSNTKIDTCRGCRECFSKTPGECSINDDMSYILRAYIAADVVVWSFPLHNFGVPAKVKTVIDRLLPLYLPFIEKDDNDLCKRPYRYDFSNKKYVIISTCDYPNSKQNYESVLAQFDLLYGKNYSKIICPEGELFSMPQFEAETTAYLSAVKDAGADFAKNGKFQNKTIHNLIEIMVEPTRFINVSNSNWNIKLDAINANEFEMDPTEKLVRQLAIAYNTQFFNRKIIFEIYFTDLDKTYQLYLGATACTLKTEIFQRFNTRIDVDFDTLSKITDHTLSCSEALNDGLLKVEGDFSTMVRL
ncbi:MAG: flavodoxin family protein, partial [Oscillospiraceae bacterium]